MEANELLAAAVAAVDGAVEDGVGEAAAEVVAVAESTA